MISPCAYCCGWHYEWDCPEQNIPPDEQPAKVLLRDFVEHYEVPANVDAAHPDGRGMTGDGGEGSVGKRASAVSRETVTEWLRRNGAL